MTVRALSNSNGELDGVMVLEGSSWPRSLGYVAYATLAFCRPNDPWIQFT